MADRDPLADDPVAMMVRYQIANARYRRIEGREPYSPEEIQRRLARGGGTALFYDSLVIKHGSVPPITADHANDAFFRAVVQQEDGVLDIDPALLDALRRYVLDRDDGLIVRFPNFPYAPST